MCDCPRCRRVPTANRRWGFDEALVSKVKCFACDRKIGRAKYRLVTDLARFGQMFFVHARCA